VNGYSSMIPYYYGIFSSLPEAQANQAGSRLAKWQARLLHDLAPRRDCRVSPALFMLSFYIACNVERIGRLVSVALPNLFRIR